MYGTVVQKCLASRPAAASFWLIVVAVIGIGTAGATSARAAETSADLVLGQAALTLNGPNIVGSRGLHTASALWGPQGIVVDRSAEPNRLYVADVLNNRILGWKNAAGLRDGAPADLVIGQPDFSHSTCNTGGVSAKTLCAPSGVAVDAKGALYVADSGNNRVLEYDAPFVKGTAADRVFGQNGGFTGHDCNKYGLTAGTLCKPAAVALDADGRLYVADSTNNRVLEYDRPLTSDRASRVLGQRGSFLTNDCNSAGGISAEGLCDPTGLAIDGKGHLYVADRGNSRVLAYDSPRRRDRAAAVLGQEGDFTTGACDTGGQVGAALCSPTGVAVDPAGHLYVADTLNNRVVEYDQPLQRGARPSGVLGQADFSGTTCNAGGTGARSLCEPGGVALDALGDVYVADSGNNRVLLYSAPVASKGAAASRTLGQVGFNLRGVNLVGTQGLYQPGAVAVDRSAASNRVYVADSANSRVLGWSDASRLRSGAPADIVIGQPDFFSSGCNGHGISAASLCNPGALAVDPKGNLYVADSGNNRVLEYDAPVISGAAARLVFGQNNDFTGNDCDRGGIASAATLCDPAGVAVDRKGNLYVADMVNSRVLEYDAPLKTHTTADRVFGQAGSFKSNDCNHDGLSANSLCKPSAVALGRQGSLYVTDTGNNRVLEFAAPPNPGAGAVRVFGQDGGFSRAECNFGGLPSDRTLCTPMGIDFDAPGNLYVADSGNNRVVEYDAPFGSKPAASLVFGQGGAFTTADCNVGGVSARTLCGPSGVALDTAGELYVADSLNNRVLRFPNPYGKR